MAGLNPESWKCMNKELIIKLWNKYKDMIPYAIFGVLTTIVNIVSYWALAHPLHIGVMVSTILAWFISVLFAYLTNRKWVFHSEAHGIREISREIISFFACRAGTELIDLACMWIFADIMGLNDVVIKTLANVIVIILNYVASKFMIFKHKDK
ncbi:MAG: GtrA family protein [Lachnospiraceae bacterium]|nr:GtrA family protein [Lachnospiraceae bacterium]